MSIILLLTKIVRMVLFAFITGVFYLGLTPTHADQPKSLQVGVNLQIRAYLQGPYDASTGLMKDTLRAKGLIPLQQPYSAAPFSYAGTETLNRSLTSVSVGGDSDALIDWVLVELRSATDPTVVIAQRALGLQADGDVMDVQTGSTTLAFLNVSPANYYVSLRHRNHLALVSASAHALSFTPNLIDFSSASFAVAGQNSRALSNSKALLWAGDSNKDKKVIVSGVGSDNNVLLTKILSTSANTGMNTSYRLKGYASTDLNLDGDSLATGPGNDANVTYVNVLSHPANTYFASNYIIRSSAY